jgi:hypothetical protein
MLAPRLPIGGAMRWLVMLSLLAACDLLPHTPGPIKRMIDAGGSACPEPKPPGECTCTDTIGWACTTCPFGEGSGVVACPNNVGSSCQIETWEHGCDCSCVAPGWWDCYRETVGSICPSAPPPDAGVR